LRAARRCDGDAVIAVDAFSLAPFNVGVIFRARRAEQGVSLPMTAMPVLGLLTASLLLGLYLVLLFLRRERKPAIVGFHLLLGAGGLEMLVMLLHGTPSGTAGATSQFGVAAAALFGIAMFTGLTGAMIARRSAMSANIVVATHSSLGVAGFVLFLAWLSSL
jgi:hypothetical protein